MKRDKQNPPDEKQTRAPGPDTSAVPSSVAGSETPDDMNADEQAVFDQIMGEIEGQESETDGDAAKLSSDNQTVSDAENDALDDDQQKAFESIMAQIEGGDAERETEGGAASTRTEPPAQADHRSQLRGDSGPASRE